MSPIRPHTLLSSHIAAYATCLAGEVCGAVQSTWGTSRGEDRLGARARILPTKVAHRAKGQTFPLSAPSCSASSLPPAPTSPNIFGQDPSVAPDTLPCGHHSPGPVPSTEWDAPCGAPKGTRGASGRHTPFGFRSPRPPHTQLPPLNVQRAERQSISPVLRQGEHGLQNPSGHPHMGRPLRWRSPPPPHTHSTNRVCVRGIVLRAPFMKFLKINRRQNR